jgi:hypothetical protein
MSKIKIYEVTKTSNFLSTEIFYIIFLKFLRLKIDLLNNIKYKYYSSNKPMGEKSIFVIIFDNS